MLRFARSVLLLAVALLLTVCNAVTRENFDQIETGMTLAQVEGILGPPTTKDLESIGLGDLKFEAGTCTWVGGDATITLTIAQGEVVLKQSEGL